MLCNYIKIIYNMEALINITLIITLIVITMILEEIKSRSLNVSEQSFRS